MCFCLRRISFSLGSFPLLLNCASGNQAEGSNTIPASRQNLYMSKVHTNSGKQKLHCTVTVLWDNIPMHPKVAQISFLLLLLLLLLLFFDTFRIR